MTNGPMVRFIRCSENAVFVGKNNIGCIIIQEFHVGLPYIKKVLTTMFHYAKDGQNRPPTLAEYAMAKKEMGMDKNDTMRKINELYDYAQKLEIELIESEARKILTADPDLDEFVMCMGRAFFTYKAGGKYDLFAYTDEELIAMENGDDPRIEFIYGNSTGTGLANEGGIIHNEAFQKEFFDMIYDMNSQSNVMGYPMRFTANGPVNHNW